MSSHHHSRFTNVALESRSTRRSMVQRGLALGGAALAGASIARAPARAQESQLEFMHWGSLLEKNEMAKTIEAFEASHPDIAVEQLYVPGDYGTKLNTLIAAGDVPDVFYIAPDTALEWALEGRVLDVTPYLDAYPSLRDRLPESYFYFEPGRTVGNMIAVEMATLFYNRDLFEDAGVPFPPAEAANAYTWDEFLKTAQLLTLDGEGHNATESQFDPNNIRQYGATIPRWWYGWYPLIRSNGADLTDESGTQFTLNSPEGVDVFQKLQDLIHTYHVSPTPTQEQNLPATNVRLQSGRAAMVIDGQWALLDVAESGVSFGMGVLPKFQEPLTILSSAGTVISGETAHVAAAVEFYAFHTDPENNVTPFAEGLWMPLERKYYTDQALIDMWTANDAHPPEYRTAVMDYTLNHSVRGLLGTYKNWPAIDPQITASLDGLWTGEKTAQQALDDMESAVQPLLQGRWPTEQ